MVAIIRLSGRLAMSHPSLIFTLKFSTLFLMLTRRLSIRDAVPRVSKQIGVRGRAVFCPYAELAMDVDKPHQFEILRADMEKQVGI